MACITQYKRPGKFCTEICLKLRFVSYMSGQASAKMNVVCIGKTVGDIMDYSTEQIIVNDIKAFFACKPLSGFVHGFQ